MDEKKEKRKWPRRFKALLASFLVAVVIIAGLLAVSFFMLLMGGAFEQAGAIESLLLTAAAVLGMWWLLLCLIAIRIAVDSSLLWADRFTPLVICLTPFLFVLLGLYHSP